MFRTFRRNVRMWLKRNSSFLLLTKTFLISIKQVAILDGVKLPYNIVVLVRHRTHRVRCARAAAGPACARGAAAAAPPAAPAAAGTAPARGRTPARARSPALPRPRPRPRPPPRPPRPLPPPSAHWARGGAPPCCPRVRIRAGRASAGYPRVAPRQRRAPHSCILIASLLITAVYKLPSRTTLHFS